MKEATKKETRAKLEFVIEGHWWIHKSLSRGVVRTASQAEKWQTPFTQSNGQLLSKTCILSVDKELLDNLPPFREIKGSDVVLAAFFLEPDEGKWCEPANKSDPKKGPAAHEDNELIWMRDWLLDEDTFELLQMDKPAPDYLEQIELLLTKADLMRSQLELIERNAKKAMGE